MNYDLKVDIYYNKGILLMVNNQSDERRHVVDQVFQQSFGHVDNLEACIKYDTVHFIGLIYLFSFPQKTYLIIIS